MTPKIQNFYTLAPFEIWEIPLDGKVIKFKQPLILPVGWLPDDPEEPDENDYLSIECPALGISAFGADREELWKCLRSDIREAWKQIVRVSDDRISKEGKKIKDAYLSIAEEVSDG